MKVIQVPMEEDEAEELMDLARSLNTSRSALVRIACRSYVAQLRREKLDTQYEKGYLAIPESLELASSSADLAGSVLPVEDWDSF